MDILNFVEKCKEEKVYYKVFKNWYQPTPHWKDFEKICTRFIGRESFDQRDIPSNMQFFLDECLKAYPGKEYSFLQCNQILLEI